MKLRTFVAVLGSVLMVGMANAATTVPEACFLCQGKTIKSDFLSCISTCINQSSESTSEGSLMSKIQSSGWILSYEQKRMTDGDEFYVMKYSENSIYYHGQEQRPLLMFMKDQTKLTKAMVIDVGPLDVRARDGVGTGFRVRIDKNSPTMIYGNVIWNGRGIIFKDLPRKVLNQLRSGSSLVMELEVAHHGTHHFEWNLDGSNAAISLIYGP